jgi:hypothetical protein
MRFPLRSCSGLAAAALLATGCAVSVFGFGVRRSGPNRFVENLDVNRYIYTVVPIQRSAPRGYAHLALSPPIGAREVGLIEVAVEYSGWGAYGLRTQASEFYPMLAWIAGQLGGTHFVQLDARGVGAWPYITSLRAGVYAVP